MSKKLIGLIVAAAVVAVATTVVLKRAGTETETITIGSILPLSQLLATVSF
jgi:Mg2+/citrate symporter